MEQNYNSKMAQLGYNQLVCDIFVDWENVKDEILLPGRKAGSGNGTIHVFLGSGDAELQKEFPSYYESVASGEDTSIGAVEVKHYFMISNIISMLGYVCNYMRDKNGDIKSFVLNTLDYINSAEDESGLLSTKSLFKLSVGSNKLRPYFKQFESDGVFTKLIRQILLPNSSYKISLYKNEEGEYAAFWLIGFDWQSPFDADSSVKNLNKPKDRAKAPVLKSNTTLQQIYYGAPGTGKSHIINEITEGESVIRTTFHPDSDYSTFVGAYKPTTKEITMRDLSGHPIVEGGKVLTEDKIVYEFVEQAFLQAYVQAWKYYADADAETKPKKQYLVIEEINRGNCAQIFGDLFQLLDRNASGFSDYPINADNDMKKQLAKAFKGLTVAQADSINACYKGKDVVSKVLSGEILLLPNNLYIWATMNTSDQSLFPIDSAFKRRWDWQYMPISKGMDNGTELNWKISADTKEYDWWSFLEKINERIGKEPSLGEDKKLGFFFCKAVDGAISAETFVGKVIFYLWNDVFRSIGFEDDIFKDSDKSELTFNKFYKTDSTGRAVVQKDKVELFLNNLGVDEAGKIIADREDDEDKSAPGTGEKQVRFWQEFNKARGNNAVYAALYNERKPQPQAWMDLSFGSSAYYPTMSVKFTKSLIRCGIWIGVSEKKDAIFENFKNHEEEINSLVGTRLKFDTKKQAYSIIADKSLDVNDEAKWPEAFTWLMDMAVKMNEVKKLYGI